MEKELIKNGYHKFDNVGFETHAECFYQKKVVGDMGDCKYFVNIYKYSKNEVLKYDHYQTKLSFYRGNNTFNIEIFHNPENNVEDIESIAAEFWSSMFMDWDHHN